MLILDGAVGTRLESLGVPLAAPAWSASALATHPELIRDIHARYAAAGATLHTTCTFRTRPADIGPAWADLARTAVQLAREAVPESHRIAGSLAPIADCWRPDLSPGKCAYAAHRELAEVLIDAGCDLVLCETFNHEDEALTAVRAVHDAGGIAWLALSPGWDAQLLTPASLHGIARKAVALGVQRIFVNCAPAAVTADYLAPLADLGVPLGAYANANDVDPLAYATHARRWSDLGCTCIGGCCGSDERHIAALAGL